MINAHWERLEVKAKSRRNGILLTVGCAVFSVGGLWMMMTGKIENFLPGLLLTIFGGIGLWAVSKILRRSVSMVLTSKGIEQITSYGSATIPWRDIEQIGVVTQFSHQMVGIRLKNYDNYLANISPELAGFMAKSLPYLKLLSQTVSLLDVPAAIELWSKLEGRKDPSEALKDFGQVGNLVEALLWSRRNYGYDILFSWADLDRPAEDFIELLEQYRARALRQVN